MAFCKDYNARTADKAGYIIPVEITVFDVTFYPSFVYLVTILTSESVSWSLYVYGCRIRASPLSSRPRLLRFCCLRLQVNYNMTNECAFLQMIILRPAKLNSNLVEDHNWQ